MPRNKPSNASASRRDEHGTSWAGWAPSALPITSCTGFVETAAVIDASRDPVASRRFDELVEAAELRIEPVTFEQARIARDAYRDFGKGSGHKAGLNFGDCFAYALAKTTGEALLFKGDDLGHTDITAALPDALADQAR
jgi:ribonuclease VapC